VAERHGYIQTVLDTAPRLVGHVICDSHLYPRTKQLTALITVGLHPFAGNPVAGSGGGTVMSVFSPEGCSAGGVRGHEL
jgi:hypothetical protein